MKLHRKIEHYDKVFLAQELGSYAQGQGSLAVFKVTARDQGHYKGPLGAFVTYCNISCFTVANNRGCFDNFGLNFSQKRSGMHRSRLTLRYERRHVK